MKQKINILVMDREDIILRSIKKALKSNGEIEYNVTTCSTALEGLKLFRSNAFDLILIDLILPGMNGIEVLRRVKNINPTIPVIIMAGYLPDKMLGDETVQSAVGFLLKPFTSAELRSLVLNLTIHKTE
jgi:DNA-binding NtrC family response regulator